MGLYNLVRVFRWAYKWMLISEGTNTLAHGHGFCWLPLELANPIWRLKMATLMTNFKHRF